MWFSVGPFVVDVQWGDCQVSSGGEDKDFYLIAMRTEVREKCKTAKCKMQNVKIHPRQQGIIIATHVVPENIAGVRLYDYAVGIFARLPSRKSVKKAIDRGYMLIDGVAGTTGTWVYSGQTIDLLEPAPVPGKIFPCVLEVYYEDDYLAVVGKPAGLVVSGNRYRSVENALPYNLTTSTAADALARPRPVHRLDGPTAGLLIVAKTATAHQLLGEAFAQRQIEKTYQAIAVGHTPDEARLDTPIDGKPALSELRTLHRVQTRRQEWLSLVELVPHTGRTHQLRIHLAEQGTPILGDKEYGIAGQVLRGKGLFLCATSLEFMHPIRQVPLVLVHPLPGKFGKRMGRWEM